MLPSRIHLLFTRPLLLVYKARELLKSLRWFLDELSRKGSGTSPESQ